MNKFFSWYGGKIRVVDLILSLVPTHITDWYELFAGSAAVTFNKPRHEIEVLNDLDLEIVHLFNVMIDRKLGAELVDRLMRLEHSERNFAHARIARKNNYYQMDDIAKAEMIFILISQSFNACRKSYSRGISPEKYSNSLQFNLPSIYERLGGVKMISHDATFVLDAIRNNINAFALADLPYLHQLRAVGARSVYGKEMSTREHVKFLETARDAKCAIMICGYRNKNGVDLYDDMLLGHGNWRHYLLAELTKSCQSSKSKSTGQEWVWLNYDPPEYARFYINMDSANW